VHRYRSEPDANPPMASEVATLFRDAVMLLPMPVPMPAEECKFTSAGCRVAWANPSARGLLQSQDVLEFVGKVFQERLLR
jgi:hypothetical protein